MDEHHEHQQAGGRTAACGRMDLSGRADEPQLAVGRIQQAGGWASRASAGDHILQTGVGALQGHYRDI